MKNRKILASVIVLICISAAGTAAFLKHIYFVPVIMYHSIDHNDKSTKLSVSPENLERQMKFLRDNRYNVVSLETIASYLEKKKRIPPKTIAITFDDGFYNNYEHAWPVLKKYGLPATMFVIVDKIGKKDFMGWDELKEMSDSGIVSIGSHTMTHDWLLESSDYTLKRELGESRTILEKELKKPVRTLCYPMGAFDQKSKKAAGDFGYICAVGTNPKKTGRGDIYAIRRIKISRTSDNLLVFWLETSGYYSWFKELRDN